MIRVGPAGWSYPDWEGIVFPRRKTRDFKALRHLARYVDCVEINSSFYSTPRAEHARAWLAQVEDRPSFRFTAKLQNVFTHEPLPEEAAHLRALVEAYAEGIEPLVAAGRLAALLVQFPHSFRRTDAAEERLAWIAQAFTRQALVLEVRHRSWFDRSGLEAIERLGFALAQLDLPLEADRPPADAPGAAKLAYLRIHGRNSAAWFDPRSERDRRYDYLYGPDEIAELVRTTRRIAQGADETYVITNNHFSGKAVANALEILAGLGELPLAPVELIEAYPRLRACTRPDGQGTLFR
jgi:uncharacterized protein YecE (DUF72 family)